MLQLPVVVNIPILLLTQEEVCIGDPKSNSIALLPNVVIAQRLEGG